MERLTLTSLYSVSIKLNVAHGSLCVHYTVVSIVKSVDVDRLRFGGAGYTGACLEGEVACRAADHPCQEASTPFSFTLFARVSARVRDMDKDARGGGGGGGGGAAKRMWKEWTPPAKHPRWPDRHALHLLLAKHRHKALKWARVRAKIAGYTCHVGLEKQQRAMGAVERAWAFAAFTMDNPYVVQLTLRQIYRPKSLRISVPSEIGLFPRLRRIWGSNDAVQGAIPTEIGQLSSLVDLNLSKNDLSGRIPTEIGRLGSLVNMHLYNNRLTGAIPTELGRLGSLVTMYLGSNQLTGAIPTELGRLGSLVTMYLDNNRLTGAIPTEICQMRSLVTMYLDNNRLTGAIPTEICQMRSLETMYLSSNQLTGAIPTELGRLNGVSLFLNNNQLTGTIP
jgi:hypothetical protein